MANPEHSEEQPAAGRSSTPETTRYAIVVAPHDGEGVRFGNLPDGRPSMTFTGEVTIFPLQNQVQEAPGTFPLSEVFAALRADSRALHVEQTAATDEQAPQEPSESPVTAADAPASGFSSPDSTSQPVTDQYTGTDKPSWVKSRSAFDELPKSENEKYLLVGNPAKKLGYRVTRKTNTRIADFILATHPDPETTQHWRIRAFGDEAEKVRDQVEVGQTGVEVTVYGPKYWTGRRKTKDGKEDTVVKGYHAGFVRVPRKYRQQEQASGTAKPSPKN